MIKSQVFLMSWCTGKRQPWREIRLKSSLPVSNYSKSRSIQEIVSNETSKRPACHVCSCGISWNTLSNETHGLKKCIISMFCSVVFISDKSACFMSACGWCMNQACDQLKTKRTAFFFLNSVWYVCIIILIFYFINSIIKNKKINKDMQYYFATNTIIL